MVLLTIKRLRVMFTEAEALIRKDKFGPATDQEVRWHYGMYRLGDDKFWAVGLTWAWEDGLKKCVKVIDGVVTDYYLIYPRGNEFISSEVNPETLEVIHNYKAFTKTENKLNTEGVAIQTNFFVQHWSQMPSDMKASLEAVNFPFKESIYLYSTKPYGDCIEFGLRKVFPDKQPLECL